MTGNGLYDPLGQPVASSPARRSLAGRAVWIALGFCVVGGAVGGWALRQAHRPVDLSTAVAPIAPLVVTPPAPANPPAPVVANPIGATGTANANPTEDETGVKVVRPSGSSPPTGTFISIPQAIALPPAPDPRLVEKTRFGILPRKGPDGSRPAGIYARPVTPDPSLAVNAPRIAIFVGGMGLKRGLTAAAAQALPPAVTLGFAPYGGDLDVQVQNARELGHEAILQIPMESFNEPDGTGMPRMLVASDSAKDTADNLHWQMARFVGYAGVANFLGAKFTADADAFAPVLKDLAARGLFYFDDGTAPRNLATTLGPTLGLPALRADIVIDALADPAVIDAGFRKLESIARDRGVAIGATTGLPTVVDRVAAFAKSLAGRGIALVPVSSLASASAPSAGP